MDTHPDLNTPETSPSGNIHGMVLAGLLGRGSELMLATTAACQTQQEHVAMVGVREIDPGEQAWLDEGKINCMTMEDVRGRGLATCTRAAVDTANQAEAGFGLTIDLDAIDPSQAPFVATPVDSGLDVDEHHRSNRRNSVAMVGTSKPRVWSPPEDRVAVQKLLQQGYECDPTGDREFGHL